MRETVDWLIHSLGRLLRTTLFASTLIITAVLSLVAVALTVSSRAANETNFDSGRMAFSLVVFLAVIAATCGIPAVFVSAREELGRLSLPRTLLVSWLIGVAYLVAALPAGIWAIASSGVGVDIWMPAVSTAKFEVVLVAVLVALAHWAFATPGAATTTAIGLIVVLAFGPLVVLGVTATLPGTEQTIKHSYIDWEKSGTVDQKTGFPSNPTCQPPVFDHRTVAHFDAVWWVSELNPIALVSSSLTPEVATYQHDNTEFDGSGAGPEPIDLFSAVDLAVRSLQISTASELVVDECQNVADYGTPYPGRYNELPPKAVIAQSRSGWVDGVTGQAIYLAVAAIALVAVRRRSPKK